MLTLGIQSGLKEAEITLIKDDEILADEKWVSERDEMQKLLPRISECLGKFGYELKDVNQIVVFVGPGAFSGTRIGVTMANTLAFTNAAEVFELMLSEYEKLKNELLKKKINDSFGEIVLKYLNNQPKAFKQATPIYSSEAKITPSKKPKYA